MHTTNPLSVQVPMAENYEQESQVPPEGQDTPKRQRLYWVDWARTQSVYNVMFGHAWWTAADQLSPKPTQSGAELLWSPANRVGIVGSQAGAASSSPAGVDTGGSAGFASMQRSVHSHFLMIHFFVFINSFTFVHVFALFRFHGSPCS